VDLGNLGGQLGRLEDLDTAELEAQVDAMRAKIESATAAIEPEIAEKMATMQLALAGKEAELAAAQSAEESAANVVKSIDTAKLEAQVEAMRAHIDSASAAIEPEIAEKMATLQSDLAGKEAEFAAAQSAAEAAGDEVNQVVTDDMAQRMSLVDDSSNGWLGLDIAEVTAESAQNLKLPAVRGVVVKRVEEKSPAAQAGLKENDVVTGYEGQVVEGTDGDCHRGGAARSIREIWTECLLGPAGRASRNIHVLGARWRFGGRIFGRFRGALSDVRNPGGRFAGAARRVFWSA
jgi:C-terminal processing protease CtpA/Prc